ncbi:hypothetical protein GLOIN_2v427163 [Rhizophagus irregularis DAOM 181602=DAOM 197198]|uniref:Transmembrane protein n=1 Tax=Rhizophagus irregularis (strain DAOM 181602 / DAOM 197198 / MUCL 43194) TaxID=747089 RepID=A0A2P4PJ33_RHIID|nr:hypothetical protein GLOIN_2v427163 [Rhizophagus irregularis DAOM 181602=DAOM 197198]POG65367.1 hypothetical protein GLOIN_2v427163 [Rhizophagus irregularis DAOM 181602=DAOM 197198]|eukprot:XP_025172233.1 hypothetical protein GLOIN_2v427163 [Rhizophagus irregularis DAOM 181602=DAOM 197198]
MHLKQQQNYYQGKRIFKSHCRIRHYSFQIKFHCFFLYFLFLLYIEFNEFNNSVLLFYRLIMLIVMFVNKFGFLSIFLKI